MQSKASFFSPEIFRRSLTRFAPLWIAYAVLWLVLLPLQVLTQGSGGHMNLASLRGLVLSLALQGGAVVNLLYAGALAMALHGWMYRRRSVNAMAALPIRREAWCLTNLAAALTASFVPNLLSALLCWAASAAIGLPSFVTAAEWLGILTLQFLFFYGLAALAAAVVGQLLALPVLYGLLNFAAVVLNAMAAPVLTSVVYGLDSVARTALSALSPAFHILFRLRPTYEVPDILPAEEIVRFEHWGYLGIIAGVGAACLIAAFLLIRHRRMEAAGDLIAVRPLRPVLKYGFTLGCALVLGVLAAGVFYAGWNQAPVPALVLCMLAGGFLGYFAAEMLLQKSFRVFRREWIGFGAFSLCLLLAMGLLEFDVFGFERRVPELEDLTEIQASFSSYNSVTVSDPAHMADLTTLHRAILADKPRQEALLRRYDGGDYENVDYQRVTLRYYLRDGDILVRRYLVCCTEDLWLDPASLPRQLSDLWQDPYFLLRAHAVTLPVTLSTADSGDISYLDPAGESQARELTAQEVLALYAECILPDLREGLVGYASPYRFEDLDAVEYSAGVYLSFSQRVGPATYHSADLSITPTVGSRTARRLMDWGIPLVLRQDIPETKPGTVPVDKPVQ